MKRMRARSRALRWVADALVGTANIGHRRGSVPVALLFLFPRRIATQD